MRALLVAVSFVFALGGFASVAHAGEGCAYEGHQTTSDFETPAPAAAVKKPEKRG